MRSRLVLRRMLLKEALRRFLLIRLRRPEHDWQNTRAFASNLD